MKSEQLAKTGYRYAPIWRRLRCIEEIAYPDETMHIAELKTTIMKLKHMCIPACEDGTAAKYAANEVLRHAIAALRATIMCKIDTPRVPTNDK